MVESDAFRVFSVVAQGPEGSVVRERLPLREYLEVVAATNFKQRSRKMMEYFHADRLNYIVLGTPNRLEYDQGFFVKNGDGAADIMPLTGLNKRQGAQLLEHLGAPPATWEKIPTADLEDDRPALPDEEALGVSYEHIDDYLEGQDVPDAARERIEHLWRIGQHKRHLPPGPHDTWWR